MDQVEEATTSPGAVAKQETKQTEVPQLGGAALPAMFTGIPASILVIKFACLFAGLLGAVTLFAPWYRQLSDRRMGHAFISGRFYGLTYVTDANFSVTQWYTVQESMCRKSGELARSQLSLKNIVTQELAHGSSGSKTSTGSWVKALGIFLHCRYRDTCKNAVYKRCQTYRTLAISLMVGLFFILFGTIILILVFFITGGDKETAVAQKLAAKKRAATKTLIFVAIGMGMHLFGYMMGFGMFDKVMIQFPQRQNLELRAMQQPHQAKSITVKIGAKMAPMANGRKVGVTGGGSSSCVCSRNQHTTQLTNSSLVQSAFFLFVL
eukprot:GEMP01036650.1.p1 GENE.GEMP01036650.1~~GEMP01036650.1.p1  ORF type:complete len:322 (+),score=39.41 GEMP01036650.1:205-1170(+)